MFKLNYTVLKLLSKTKKTQPKMIFVVLHFLVILSFSIFFHLRRRYHSRLERDVTGQGATFSDFGNDDFNRRGPNMPELIPIIAENGRQMKNSAIGFTIHVVASSMVIIKSVLNYADGTGILYRSTTSFNLRLLFNLISILTMFKWFNQLAAFEHFFNEKSCKFGLSFLKEILLRRKHLKVAIENLSNNLVTFQQTKENNFVNLNRETENPTLLETNVPFSDKHIVKICLIFFLAGFESSAQIPEYIYELASDPVIQSQLNYELNHALDGVKVHSEEYYGENSQNEITNLGENTSNRLPIEKFAKFNLNQFFENAERRSTSEMAFSGA